MVPIDAQSTANAKSSGKQRRKIIKFDAYKKQEHVSNFTVGTIYKCVFVEDFFIRIVGEQTIDCDFNHPKLFLAETNTGDLAILMGGDEYNWLIATNDAWVNSIPSELKD